MKSKMPCEPGPEPLIKFAQATGLCGGILVPRLLNPPAAAIFDKLGRSPATIMVFVSRGSIPSMPITITRFPRLRGTRFTPPTQYDAAATAPAPAKAPFSTDRRDIPDDVLPVFMRLSPPGPASVSTRISPVVAHRPPSSVHPYVRVPGNQKDRAQLVRGPSTGVIRPGFHDC